MDVGIPNPYYYEPQQRTKSEEIVRYAKAMHLKTGPTWLRGTDFAAAIQYGENETPFAELLLFDSSGAKYAELLQRLSYFPMTVEIRNSRQQFLLQLGLDHLVSSGEDNAPPIGPLNSRKIDSIQVQKFIERLQATQALLLMTEDQEVLCADARLTFEWLGDDLIELIRRKMTEM